MLTYTDLAGTGVWGIISLVHLKMTMFTVVRNWCVFSGATYTFIPTVNKINERTALPTQFNLHYVVKKLLPSARMRSESTVVTLGARMRSEGTVVGSVCLSVSLYLTPRTSVRPRNDTIYPTGDEGQNFRTVLSETAPLQN